MTFAAYAFVIQLMLVLKRKGVLTAEEIDAIMNDTVTHMRANNNPHADDVARIIASTFEAASPSQH